ncbi:hypothetical protein CLV84_3191 [Neolewinella xylanilytica]|uniref:Uncharacterized protein n=1 Tax=Neolewinella xylanilytica TaxID=1514080 RepID=A0A2S6I525_9BACT|nr:hypothetical protein [Neolewinella xylanilytica]PPK86268.1 hypothetical protein CLV84_3191 [Neolewinella xylanilytica]
MAQIRIEEKPTGGSSIWPWIIGLLLLGLVVWGVAEAFDDSEEVYTEEVVEDNDGVAGVATGIDENNNYNDYDEVEGSLPAVATYMNTTASMDGEMGLDHEFSHRALTELADATKAIAEEKGLMSEASVMDKSDRIDRLANEIMEDPMAGDHADKIKMASMLIVEMMEDIDTQSNSGSNSADIDALRQEAQAMTAETLTLNQKEDVRSFFSQARTVLQNLS